MENKLALDMILAEKGGVFFLKFLLFYYSYVHTMLGSFLPHAPTPSLTTHSAPSLSLPPL
jgi:hypothetical protein